MSLDRKGFVPNVHARVFVPKQIVSLSPVMLPSPAMLPTTNCSVEEISPLSDPSEPVCSSSLYGSSSMKVMKQFFERVIHASDFTPKISSSNLPTESVHRILSFNAQHAHEKSGEDSQEATEKANSRFHYNPSARSFNPKFSLAPMCMLPPSMVEDAPQLHTRWSLYCVLPNAHREFVPTKIHTVSDVREFWGLMNNLHAVKESIEEPLFQRLSIYLFRENIEPIWEHKMNIRGGSWHVTLPGSLRDSMDEKFRTVCSWAVSEPITSVPSEVINGIGIKIRSKFTLELWLSDKPSGSKDRASYNQLIDEVCQIIDVNSVRGEFFSHQQKVQDNFAPAMFQRIINN